MEKFYLKKLRDTEVKEKYQVKNSNTCIALENLDMMMMMMTWTSIGSEKVTERI
jgi:hypothetical protein